MKKTHTKRGEKKVKAWALMNKGVIDIATPNEDDARYFAKVGEKISKRLIPCTITYSLPTKKAKKKKI